MATPKNFTKIVSQTMMINNSPSNYYWNLVEDSCKNKIQFDAKGFVSPLQQKEQN